MKMKMDIVEIIIQFGSDVWATAQTLNCGEIYEFESSEHETIRLRKLSFNDFEVEYCKSKS